MIMSRIYKAALILVLPMQAISDVRAQEQEAPAAAVLGVRPLAYQSTMFYAEELARIDLVMDAVKNQRPLPGEPEKEEAPAEPEKPAISSYTYPQFQLNSIAYYGANNWTIWVNGKKMTSAQPRVLPGLTVVSVTKRAARFTYSYAGDTVIKPPLKSSDRRITIDKEGETTNFVLAPNQTMSVYSWKVYEGAVRPVTVVINANQKEKDDDDAAAISFDSLMGEPAAPQRSKPPVIISP